MWTRPGDYKEKVVFVDNVEKHIYNKVNNENWQLDFYPLLLNFYFFKGDWVPQSNFEIIAISSAFNAPEDFKSIGNSWGTSYAKIVLRDTKALQLDLFLLRRVLTNWIM